MKLRVSGTPGEELKVAMRAVPTDGAVVIMGKAPHAELFAISATPAVVGTIPCEVVFTINCDFRPWEFGIETLVGERSVVSETSSAALGFPDGTLIRPDTLRITVEGVDAEGGAHA